MYQGHRVITGDKGWKKCNWSVRECNSGTEVKWEWGGHRKCIRGHGRAVNGLGRAVNGLRRLPGAWPEA